MTISYQELFQKSNEFIQFLNSHSVNAQRVEESFRDYNVKIKINSEVFTLYHKPSKKTFSISTHEFKSEELKTRILDLWDLFNSTELFETTGLCAYVDGSCIGDKIGWGIVLVEDKKVLAQKNGALSLTLEEGSRQIAGEIQAVLQALSYAQSSGYSSVTIFYDYVGLQKWACGEWKTKSLVAQEYIQQLKQFSLNISWKKVQAHTGQRFNELADQLAKSAIT